MKNINASIITIGDELLIGQTIDTNSAWIGQELNRIGVWVHRRLAVGDVWNDIWNALDAESKESDLVLITGGLGPTADDITKPLLCKYFGGSMVVNEKVLQHVKDIFTRLNRPMLERNLKQAEVPDVCTVLFNARGTAPGMLFKKEGKLFVSLPGVPHEMKGLMKNEVLPLLQKEFTLPAILHKTIFTAGMGESFIAERIKEVEEILPAHIKLAYLPAYGMVRLRLTARGNNKLQLEQDLLPYFNQLKELVKDVLVAEEDEGLEITLGKILKARNKTMATAESCTGGYIAHLITSVAGSSAYFKGSVVSYANDVKENILNVSADTLKTTGAVSEETVKQMVKGAIENLQADFALATSGIMGPKGGTPEKPVGTVWMAVGNKEKTEAQKLFFRFDRERNIEMTAQAALNLLRKFILANS
jgi:nicotinamide-nucleotide amidase